MTFKRPSNITYTQMAQWVDSNATLAECDENRLCQYLYYLVYIKAQQCSLCRDAEQFDDFSIYCLSKLFNRLRSKNIAEPVKSISNYIKTILSPWYAEYVREFCCGSADLELVDFDPSDFSDYLVDAASLYDQQAYNFDCFQVSVVVSKHLKRIPRKKNSAEWSNIYVSCLLTLHDRIKAAVLLSKNTAAKEDPLLMNAVIRMLKTKPPILFHVEESNSAYISVLVNEIVHAIAAELTSTTASKVTVGECLRNLVAAASNEEEE